MPNSIKHHLLHSIPSVGCWLTLASPAVTELLAHCGFDWLVIDTEHGPGDVQDVAAQLRAIDAANAQGARVTGAVRVTTNDAAQVKRVMDCGALRKPITSKCSGTIKIEKRNGKN